MSLRLVTAGLAVAASFAAGYATRTPSGAPLSEPTSPAQQDPPAGSKTQAPDKPSDNEELSAEEQWKRALRYAMPGQEHLWLGGMRGKWDVEFRLTPPGQPSSNSHGISEIRTELGGRFIVEDVRGDLGGNPYQALGVTGYDRLAQQYVSFWMDTFGTEINMSAGKREDKGTLVLRGDKHDILRPKPRAFRTEIDRPDDTTMERKIYDTIDGNEVLVLTMVYKR